MLRKFFLNLVPVILEARCAQTLEAVLVDRPLPGQELIDGELVALTRLLEAEQATAHCGDNFRLATDYPALGIARRQVGNRERASVRADDVTRARSELLVGHDTQYSP